MRKVFAVLSALLLLLGLAGCGAPPVLEDTADPSAALRGNLDGNLNTGGYFATDGERLYFSVTARATLNLRLSIGDLGLYVRYYGLYSSNFDGTDLKRLSGEEVEGLNYWEGWLIGATTDNAHNSLVRIRTDGSERETLHTAKKETYIRNLHMFDGQLYFCEDEQLLRCNPDGSARVVLYEGPVESFALSSQYIFFTVPFLYDEERGGYWETHLYRMTLEGKERERVPLYYQYAYVQFPENLTLSGDWLYLCVRIPPAPWIMLKEQILNKFSKNTNYNSMRTALVRVPVDPASAGSIGKELSAIGFYEGFVVADGYVYGSRSNGKRAMVRRIATNNLQEFEDGEACFAAPNTGDRGDLPINIAVVKDRCYMMFMGKNQQLCIQGVRLRDKKDVITIDLQKIFRRK